MERAIEIALEDMRQKQDAHNTVLKAWKSAKRDAWYEIEKVNVSGCKLRVAASTASSLINLLKPHINTRDFELELLEIDEVYESLGS
jgi:hypothetical protein